MQLAGMGEVRKLCMGENYSKLSACYIVLRNISLGVNNQFNYRIMQAIPGEWYYICEASLQKNRTWS